MSENDRSIEQLRALALRVDERGIEAWYDQKGAITDELRRNADRAEALERILTLCDDGRNDQEVIEEIRKVCTATIQGGQISDATREDEEQHGVE